MLDTTEMIKVKRDQLRTQIRKNELENIFKQKRIIDIKYSQNKYLDLHQGLYDNVEQQSQILVQNKELMQELLNSNEKIVLIILANCCASEQFQTIQILINEYKIHHYFMNILIKETQSKEIIQKCYAGLANLLFSDQKQVTKIKEYLYENQILTIILQNLQHIQNNENDIIISILRLLCGLLKNITQILKKPIRKQDIVEICMKVINWIEIELQLSIHVLILSTQICSQLLELFDDEKYQYLINKIEISQDKEACLIIRLLDELFITSEKQLIISFLDNSNLDRIFSNILKSQNNYSKYAVLDFLYNRVVSNNVTLQQFVFLLYDEIIDIITTTTNERKLDISLKILIELVENELIEKSERNKLFQIILEVSDRTYLCTDIPNCVLALQLVLILKNSNENLITQERKKKLRQMRETENDELEEIILLILEN